MSTPTAPLPAVPNGGVRVPQWVFILLGGGGIAIGGGGLTVGSIDRNAVAEPDATIELRIEALEEQRIEADAEMDKMSRKLGPIRDNQLLMCQALDVECDR